MAQTRAMMQYVSAIADFAEIAAAAAHGRAAHATVLLVQLEKHVQFYPPGEFEKRHGANLPHWRAAGATYFVTYRLADSIPSGVLENLIQQRDELLEIVQKKRDEKAAAEIERDFHRKFHGLLDKGLGECWMKRCEVADCVAESLKHFVGVRYDLWAWCVMPNHVHAVVQPLEGFSLAEILHTWRSFTAHRINKIVGRAGQLWQEEPFDHVVRSGEKLLRFVRYTVENPAKAWLKNWRWVGKADF